MRKGLLSLALLNGGVTAVEAARKVTLPSSLPDGAARVPPDFVSFGFGQAWLPDYARHTLSENLVNSVASRMSVKPIIRLGGTNGDYLLFDPNQEEDKVCTGGPDCDDNKDDPIILGPSYFDYFKSFPNARMTFQAPLGPTLNISNTLAYVKRAYDQLGADRVDAIALGNEPSFYDSLNKYVSDSKTAMDAIIDNLGLEGYDKAIFEVGDILSHAAQIGDPYTAKDVLEAGINSQNLVKYAAEHYYQITQVDDAELPKTLMNHDALTNHLDALQPTIDYIQNTPGVEYILSETGTGTGYPASFSDYFGATLWSVDFNLASMSRNISRVVDSGRPASKHSSWVPHGDIPNGNPGPSVRAPFAADVMMADFVGKEDTAVVEASIENQAAHISAYASYAVDTGKLQKVALLNLHVWKQSSGRDRLNETLSVPVGDGMDHVTVRRLQADAGAEAAGFDLGGAKNNVTWAGEQWTYEVDDGKGHFVEGVAREETLSVHNGFANVVVPSSEAVVVYLE